MLWAVALWYLVRALIGVAVGFLAALMGVGGGFILTPTLILLFGLEAHEAVGTSSSIVLFTGLSSFIAYARQRRVDWKVGLILEVTSVPGAFLGALAAEASSAGTIQLLFAAFLAYVSYRMWRGMRKEWRGGRFGRFTWSRRLVDSDGNLMDYGVNMPVAAAVSFAAGLAAGFFGIGGGVLKVPILTYCGMPIHVAIATSSFMIMITALSSASTHFALGNVALSYTVSIAVGVVVGTQFGAYVAKRTEAARLRRIFAVALGAVSVIMALKGFGFLG